MEILPGVARDFKDRVPLASRSRDGESKWSFVFYHVKILASKANCRFQAIEINRIAYRNRINRSFRETEIEVKNKKPKTAVIDIDFETVAMDSVPACGCWFPA